MKMLLNTLGRGRQADSLILIGMVAFVAINVMYDLIKLPEGWWYVGNAFAFVCYSVALWTLRRNYITEVLMVLTGAQFIDEFWGDPTIFEPWEYLIFIFIAWLGIKRVIWK